MHVDLNVSRRSHTAIGCVPYPIAGSFCDDTGLNGPAGPCDAGFYCGGGATTATPDSGSANGYQGDTCVDRSNGTINDVCPPGHYCPEGAMNSQSSTQTIFHCCAQSPHVNMPLPDSQAGHNWLLKQTHPEVCSTTANARPPKHNRKCTAPAHRPCLVPPCRNYLRIFRHLIN